MKNRIQELAEQAGLLGPSSRGGNAHEAAEKFAALIIAECAKACEPRPWVGLTDDELLKTYGWEFVSYGQSDRPSLGPSILDEAKQEIIDGLRKVEALLKEKNHD